MASKQLDNELNTFDAEHFVAHYWQKRPCVIRQFCPNFEDPIDENDLAGLAMEPDVDSRIVSLSDNKWDVAQGPFDDFNAVCKGAWTLLAQGVDRYIDELSDLTERVNFIPHWRFDDVMVSYSVADAGVGPHIDEYDVFIVQGRGKRRWQIGMPCDAKTQLPHPLLKQIDGFEPCIDTVLEAGDAVYIPPKHPHNGVALTPCMNYSLGFRAPTDIELLTGLLDEVDDCTEQKRYSDPNLADLRNETTSPSAMNRAEITALKQHMIQFLKGEQAEPALLTYLSRQGIEPEQTSEQLAEQDLRSLLDQGYTLDKLPAVRPVHLASTEQTDEFAFFVDGHSYRIACSSEDDKATVEQLLNAPQYRLDEGVTIDAHGQRKKAEFSDMAAWIELLCQLVNDGYWELNEAD